MIKNKDVKEYSPKELSKYSLESFLLTEKINESVHNFLGVDVIKKDLYTDLIVNYKWNGLCNLYMAYLLALSVNSYMDDSYIKKICDSFSYYYGELKEGAMNDYFTGYNETEFEYLKALNKIPFKIEQYYISPEYNYLNISKALDVTGIGCVPKSLINLINSLPADEEVEDYEDYEDYVDNYIYDNIEDVGFSVDEELYSLSDAERVCEYRPFNFDRFDEKYLMKSLRILGYNVYLVTMECDELDIYIDSKKDNPVLIDSLKEQIEILYTSLLPGICKLTQVQIIDRNSNIYNSNQSISKCKYQVISLVLSDYIDEYSSEYNFNFNLAKLAMRRIYNLWNEMTDSVC